MTSITTQNTSNKFSNMINTIPGPSGATGGGGADALPPNFNASNCGGSGPSAFACTNDTQGLVYLCLDDNAFYVCEGSVWQVTVNISTATGSSGSTGRTGFTGAQGGVTGGTGSSGMVATGGSGRTGVTGASGGTGAFAATGATGFSGVSGASGAIGASGATGLSGPSGSIPNTINVAKLVTVGLSVGVAPTCASLYASADLLSSTRYIESNFCNNASNVLTGVTYSPVLNMWVAIGGPNFSIKTIRSFDGYVWYQGNGTPNMTTLNFITWAQGIFLVGGSDAVNDLVWTSTNGLTFVAAGSNLRALGATNLAWATYSPSEAQWVGVNGTAIFRAATPAGPWSLVTASLGQVSTVCYGASTWMAIGNGVIATSTSASGPFVAFTSLNATVNNYFGCAYGSGFFVLTGANATTNTYAVYRVIPGTSVLLDSQSLGQFTQRVTFSENFHQFAITRSTVSSVDGATTLLSSNPFGTAWYTLVGPGLARGVAFVSSV